MVKEIEMEQLAIVRHGHDDHETERLDELGRLQIEALGAELNRTREEDSNVLILTSPIPRARDSAMVLKEILHAPVEEHVVLQSDGGVQQAYTLIHQAGPANLIVAVTHLEHAVALPGHMAARDFHIILPWITRVGNGQGTLLDYRSKTSRPLAPTVQERR